MATAPDTTANPLLETSSLPFGAFPFDRVKNEHYKPALEAAIQEARAKIEAVRASKDEATFANTILGLETASELVGRVAGVFFNLLSAESNDEMQKMAQELSPMLADFSSDILLDATIFKRVKAVWDAREKTQLKGEDFRLTEKSYKDFVRNGALLDSAQKDKLRAIDQEMAKLSPEFADNVRKYVNDFKLTITDAKDLDGLPDGAKEAMSEAAKEAGLQGWLVTLQYPSYAPFMTYATNRALREKLYRASGAKAFGAPYNNEALAQKIATLRHDRAMLLGFATHGHFVLEERMAENPDKVMSFLERIRVKAKPAADRDVQEIRDFKKQETGDETLMPWDYSFWSEKLKSQKYAYDEEELRPYFKLENVIEGVFEHARRLYALKFVEVTNLPTYHPDVKVFEVADDTTGRHIGLLYADFFPRAGKQGGAWQTTFRDQGFQGGKVERAQVAIVGNFTKPTATKPSLLTLDEVRTTFHEFGHALHSLLSDCYYVSIGGTNVYWDFVELPSQIMENWALEDESLDLFAHHYQTGERIPKELTAKIRASQKFQAGYQAMRQVTLASLDMAWHSGNPALITDVGAFEQGIIKRTAMLPIVEGTNLSASFSHIFAGGYSAGYYSYKWAEVLDADAFELFKQRGIFDPETARSFRENILSKGGSKHPMELYKSFRGREPDPDALLRRDGLI